MGLPMIVPAMYLMILALVPVVLIEALSLRKTLKLPFRTSILYTTIANIVSTIVGIPVTWFLLVFFQLITGGGGAYGIDTFWKKVLAVTWQAAWLMPYESESNWMGYAAMLFLLIPFFFASWIIEHLVTRKRLAQALYRHREQNTESEQSDPVMKKLMLEGFDPETSRAWQNANLLSYAVLAMFLIVLFVLGLRQGN